MLERPVEGVGVDVFAVEVEFPEVIMLDDGAGDLLAGSGDADGVAGAVVEEAEDGGLSGGGLHDEVIGQVRGFGGDALHDGRLVDAIEGEEIVGHLLKGGERWFLFGVDEELPGDLS